jgi:peptidoglycan/LPS O-acetylase OafA/YrhL
LARLRCLDGLRGVLATYVMVSHVVPFAAMPGWLQAALSHGRAGVDAFFVLSGMVIVQSLRAHGYHRGRFLAARAWRIFPVFLPVFALAVAVQALDPRIGGGLWDALPWIDADSEARYLWSYGWPPDWPASILAHLTMTHGLFPDAVLPCVWMGFLGPAWSLSAEWQFYALAALAAPFLARGRLDLMGFAGLLLALAALGAAWQAVAPPGLTFSRAFLPNEAQYFALGVASAALPPFLLPPPGGEGRGGGMRVAPWPAFAGTLAGTLLLCLLHGADKLAVPLVWLACLAAQLMPRRTGTGWLAWLLTRRPVLWLGAVSYPLYLVHAPVQKLLGRALAAAADGDAAWFSAIWLPASLLLPLGLAWLLHVWIEVPAMRRGVARGRADSLFAAPGWISQTRSPKPPTPMSRSRTG